jgi:hypothetical protein
MRRIIGFLALIAAVLLMIFYAAHNQPSKSDREQIISLIAKGQQSIERKSVNGVMSCVSNNYSDDMGNNADRLRVYVADAFRQPGRFQVAVQTPLIEVRGSQAAAAMHVEVDYVASGERDKVFSGDITLILKKEHLRRFLIFPTKEWRVVSAAGIAHFD